MADVQRQIDLNESLHPKQTLPYKLRRRNDPNRLPRQDEPDNGLQHPMFWESKRLLTFTNWPCAFMSPKNLAKAGFYYTNVDDRVKCAFCNVEIGKWEEGDEAMADHQKWSKGCPFVRNMPCGNVPIESDSPAPQVLPRGYDTCGKYGVEVRPNSYPERECSYQNSTLNLSKLGIKPSRGQAYPSYAILSKRLSSFEEWPRCMKQRPTELAAAGFFYTGKGDQTLCFSCGGGLKDWEDNDDPWEQHAKWFPSCSFVVLQKGQEYISSVCSKQEAVLTSSEAADLNCPSSSSRIVNVVPVNHKEADPPAVEPNKPIEIKTKELASESSSPTSALCKICYAKEVGVFFLPCGHIVACVDCAPALSTCAVCRKPLEAILRGFLS